MLKSVAGAPKPRDRTQCRLGTAPMTPDCLHCPPAASGFFIFFPPLDFFFFMGRGGVSLQLELVWCVCGGGGALQLELEWCVCVGGPCS